MIAALAGRRIDAPDAREVHFPADRIEAVKERIRRRFAEDSVSGLVCAAACGADLLALSAAAELAIPWRIVLPFSVEVFERRSVVDRPGPYPWGTLYSRFIGDAEKTNALRLLGFAADEPGVFEKANGAILDEALSLAEANRAAAEAIAVWDATRRSKHDYTQDFVDQASRREILVKSVPILAPLREGARRERG